MTVSVRERWTGHAHTSGSLKQLSRSEIRAPASRSPRCRHFEAKFQPELNSEAESKRSDTVTPKGRMAGPPGSTGCQGCGPLLAPRPRAEVLGTSPPTSTD